MKKIAASIALALIFGLVGVSTPAQATTFNIPNSVKGGTAETEDVFNHESRLEIDRSKPKDDLYISTYGISNAEVRDSLFRAIDRKVNVHLLTWNGDTYTAYDKIEAKIGHDPKKDSWAVKCNGSCASKKKGKGANHVKVLTNETTGRTMLASGNLTNTGGTKWNEFQSTYDKKVYKTFSKWIAALGYDKNVKSPKSIKSGGWKVDFLPGGPDNRAKEISNVNCKAYNLNGKTVRPIIAVASMIWTDARDNVAKALVKKRDEKCTVIVVMTPGQTESKPMKTLRNAKIDMWASDGRVKMHAKSITIKSKKVNRVITGTTNLGSNGVNTNAILTLDSFNEVDQHLRWINLVIEYSRVYN